MAVADRSLTAPAPGNASDDAWKQIPLSVVVVGASGDLAKRKTYPALLRLFESKQLPTDVLVVGYARSVKTHQELREQIKPFLLKTKISEAVVDAFLQLCFYQSGKSYGDLKGHQAVLDQIEAHEARHEAAVGNRLYYLAVPPGVFAETAKAIKALKKSGEGNSHAAAWTRVVIEKPFGRDLTSCEALLRDLSEQLEEKDMFRIDHYLGKRIVQDYMTDVSLRADNGWIGNMYCREAVDCVSITWMEPFGTEGRGGYFDEYGIARDVIQNHLLQVLTLVAMEIPTELDADGNAVRDAKVEVLKNMKLDPDNDVRLGQYVGYSDDPTISNKDTRTATFATVVFYIDTDRWRGVPFIVQAGKAMDRHVCEVKMRMRSHSRNEFVMRLQPDPYVGMATQVGAASTSMDLQLPPNDHMAFANDAYAVLLADVLNGRRASFVRDDELKLAWELVAPLVENDQELDVQPYEFGGKPEGFDAWLEAKKNSGVASQPRAAL